jgi:hypothetical protein
MISPPRSDEDSGDSPPFSYEESVLAHLEKIQEFPEEVQAEIARGVDSYLVLARAATEEAILERLARNAMDEAAKAIGLGATTMDPG